MGRSMLTAGLLAVSVFTSSASFAASSSSSSPSSSEVASFVSSLSSSTSLFPSLSSSSSSSLSQSPQVSAPIAGCGYAGADLSTLHSSTDDLTASDGAFVYYVNMCGTVLTTRCSDKSSAMVCMVDNFKNQIALAYYEVGGTLGGTWSYLNNDASSGLAVSYSNGDGNCENVHNSQYEARLLNLQFPCATTQDTSFSVTTAADDNCHFTMVLNTPLTCSLSGGSSSSSGLSGGWIFVILLLSLSLVYVLAGCYYKAERQGATGIERCPNIDFWREVPGLLRDGCRFTYNKIRGLCGGSPAAKGSYDEL